MSFSSEVPFSPSSFSKVVNENRRADPMRKNGKQVTALKFELRPCLTSSSSLW